MLESVLCTAAEEVLATFMGLDVAENFFIRQEMQSWAWARTAWVTNFIDLNLESKRKPKQAEHLVPHFAGRTFCQAPSVGSP